MDQLPRGLVVDRLSAAQMATVARCIARVLADSNRTEDIMIAEEIAAQAQLRRLMEAGVFDSDEGRDLLRDKPSFADVDMDELARLPEHTLGGALARFHERNGLGAYVYQVPERCTEDPELAFLMRRVRHSHDVWHVLTGFTPAGHDEILLHAFSLAQSGMPSSAALMFFGSIKHMLLEARIGCLLFGMQAAYERGRQARNLLDVYWERHWETPLQEVRQRYGIVPWSDADHASTRPWSFTAPTAVA